MKEKAGRKVPGMRLQAMTDINGDRLVVNLGASQVRKRLKGHGFGVRKVFTDGKNRAVIIIAEMPFSKQIPDPSPEEIRQTCEAIQRTWSPRAWLLRAELGDSDLIPRIRAYRTEHTPNGVTYVPEDAPRIAPSSQPKVRMPGKLRAVIGVSRPMKQEYTLRPKMRQFHAVVADCLSGPKTRCP